MPRSISMLDDAGWVGGLAAVCGLLSFTLPHLTAKDIQDIEVDALKRLAKASEDVREREQERDNTTAEIARLALQRSEMEVLVIQASHKLFLEDQYKMRASKILLVVDQDKDLKDDLLAIAALKEKIISLNIQIHDNPNVELLNSIVASLEIRTRKSDDPFFNTMILATESVVKVVARAMQSIVKS